MAISKHIQARVDKVYSVLTAANRRSDDHRDWPQAFRVNYGQGQVSGMFRTKAEAQRELASTPNCGGCYIQFRDNETNEWFRVR